jgi:hypothetical protein
MSDPSKLRKVPDPDVPNAGKTLERLMSDTSGSTSPGTILGVLLGDDIKAADRAPMEALLQDTCAIADALEHSLQVISEEDGGLEKLHSMLYNALTGTPSAESLRGDDDGVS